MELKEKIIELKQGGLTNRKIANQLGCSPSTVSYHTNIKTKLKAKNRKRIERNSKPSPYIDKEIEVDIKTVDWKYAEAVCNSRLIELGYETFHSFSDNSEIDVIAVKDNNVYRIQIKSYSPIDMSIPCNVPFKRSANRIKKNETIYGFQLYTKIDWLMIYDGTNVYKLDSVDIDKNVSLRYTIPQNNQIQDIKMASDYIF